MESSVEQSRTLWNQDDWHLRGLCRAEDPEAFFYPDGVRGRAKKALKQRAVAICVKCPVLETCRKWALDTRQPFGIYGGLDEKDRAVILKPQAEEESTQSAEQESSVT